MTKEAVSSVIKGVEKGIFKIALRNEIFFAVIVSFDEKDDGYLTVCLDYTSKAKRVLLVSEIVFLRSIPLPIIVEALNGSAMQLIFRL